MKTDIESDLLNASEGIERDGGAKGRESLVSLAALFLRLGATSFGGPAAHIAMMEDEFVRRRKWISRDEFLDIIGAANLIPGPNSTETAMHIGMKRAGWPGFLLAGICFILPAFVIVMACGWVYVEYGTLPQAAGLLAGVKPVIIAVIAQALWGFGKTAMKTRLLWTVAGTVLVANLIGLHEIAALFIAGAVTALAAVMTSPRAPISAAPIATTAVVALAQSAADADTRTASAAAQIVATATAPATAVAAAASVPFGLWPLFLYFAKIGSILYGSGYVLIAFLRADLVERFGWLTESQLIDAIAVGQMTPGPVFTAATFIGYVMGGPSASLAATVGIFLPAFLFVAISAPLIPRIRRSKIAGAFLDGVNAASLALMAAVFLFLVKPVALSAVPAVMAVASAVLLIKYRVNSSWLVIGGGAIGAVLL